VEAGRHSRQPLLRSAGHLSPSSTLAGAHTLEHWTLVGGALALAWAAALAKEIGITTVRAHPCPVPIWSLESAPRPFRFNGALPLAWAAAPAKEVCIATARLTSSSSLRRVHWTRNTITAACNAFQPTLLSSCSALQHVCLRRNAAGAVTRFAV